MVQDLQKIAFWNQIGPAATAQIIFSGNSA